MAKLQFCLSAIWFRPYCRISC